jgi:hypothetical protein
MGAVSVGFTGLLNDGVTVIESGAIGTAINVAKQFSFAMGTNALDATIDVESDRKTFTGTATTDTFSLSFSDLDSGDYDFAATAPTIDYAFDGDEAAISGVAIPNLAGGTSAMIEDTDGIWNATVSGVTNFTNALAVVSVSGTEVIEVGSHDLDADLTYTPANVNPVTGASTEEMIVLAEDADAGEWTLNGAQIYVPYFPVNFSGMTAGLVLTNEGNQEGEIDLVAFDADGNQYGPVTLTDQVMPESIINISSADVAEAFGIHWSEATKLALTATINVKKDGVVGTGYIQKVGFGRQSLTTIAK